MLRWPSTKKGSSGWSATCLPAYTRRLGDIVLYDQQLRMDRLWVPGKKLRWWLRFWRRQGYIALSLKQWKRNGQRPFPRVRPGTDRLAEARKVGIRKSGSVT